MAGGKRNDSPADSVAASSGGARLWRAHLLYGVKVSAVVVVLAASGYGLLRMERWVLAWPSFSGQPRLRLVNTPTELQGDLAAAVESLRGRPWSDATICADVAKAIAVVPWVKKVVRVQRLPDGEVEVDCQYRIPVALVQAGDGFYLIDEDCIRLPGQYVYHPALKLIQGVDRPPPPAGECWQGPDLRAAVALIRLLSPEPFVDQIRGVLVQNYGGRRDAGEAHVELATDRTGGRVIWGSAIGEEAEENTVPQKLDILRVNYRRFGHVDAHRGVIDISVFPDRIKTPA